MKKKYKWIVVGLVVMIGIITSYVIYQNKQEQKRINEALLLEEIKSHYSKYVIVNEDSILYKKDNDEYKEVGMLFKNKEVELDTYEIQTSNDQYFPIVNTDYYVSYQYVLPIDLLSTYDTYYKNYIPFNESIIDKKITFYDENDHPVMTLEDDFHLPIIMKEDQYYGVEYEDRLLYVRKDEVNQVIDSKNTDKEIATDITILLYHFFHDHDRYENMNIVISMRTDKFDAQMKYLSENDWMTLSLLDLEMFIDGKINLPKKSVMLTIDDGHQSIYSLGYPIMEKYNIKATIFNIEGYHPGAYSKATKNIEMHSHSHSMHEYKCGGLGYITCIDYNQGIEDLNKTKVAMNNTPYFSYPFGHYNDHAIKMLKDAGFTMAVTTDTGTVKVGTDKFKLPRYYIYNENSLEWFINRISN